MALAIQFSPASMTAEQYDKSKTRLQEADAWPPAGRLVHVIHGKGDSLRVFDVWDSQESFERFGATLMPILGDIGIDAGAPEVTPVHELAER